MNRVSEVFGKCLIGQSSKEMLDCSMSPRPIIVKLSIHSKCSLVCNTCQGFPLQGTKAQKLHWSPWVNPLKNCCRLSELIRGTQVPSQDRRLFLIVLLLLTLTNSPAFFLSPDHHEITVAASGLTGIFLESTLPPNCMSSDGPVTRGARCRGLRINTGIGFTLQDEKGSV